MSSGHSVAQLRTLLATTGNSSRTSVEAQAHASHETAIHRARTARLYQIRRATDRLGRNDRGRSAINDVGASPRAVSISNRLGPIRRHSAIATEHTKPPATPTKAAPKEPSRADFARVLGGERVAKASAKVVKGDDALGDIEAQLVRIRELDKDKPRRAITIIGAGMAGLAAAYELEKLGHQVRIIEGSHRIGGRVWTHRFKDGTYHELGAMRIPKSHDYTRHYVDELGLTLRKFVTSHANLKAFYDIRDVQTRIEDAKTTLYPKFDLKKEDAELPTAPAIAGKVLGDLFESLTEKERASLFSTELATERLRKLDQMSLKQLLLMKVGESATELTAASDGSEMMLDRAVTEFLREEVRKTGDGLEEIAGGMDQLPHGIAKRLKGKIELRTKVTGIHQREDGTIDLTLERKGKTVTETVDHVICTLPFPVLRQLDVSFSPGKMKAIRNLSYDAATKVLLHTKRRFWETDYGIYGGASHSDRIIRATYYPSDNAEEAKKPKRLHVQRGLLSSAFDKTTDETSAKPGVLVGSYAWGQDARRLGALSPKDRAKTVVSEVSRFHPEIAEPGMVDGYATMAWEKHPWSGGAYAMNMPGEHPLYKEALKPEGNIHFAGEHTSLDHGWIQGALISALRAVEEIVSKAAAEKTTKEAA
jgi:monoamine oxidase